MAPEALDPSTVVVRRLLSHSSESTEALAAELASVLEPGSVVALDGELGAGKTCWVRGLARGLECTAPVASPTYTLMHEYPGRRTLYHFDAWMQGREEAFLAGGGAEWLNSPGVSAIEWAERVAHHLPAPRIAVRLAHRGPSTRSIELGVTAQDAREPRALGYARLIASLRLPQGVEEQREVPR